MTNKELDIVLSALWFAHYQSQTQGDKEKYLKVFKKLDKERMQREQH